MTQILITTTLQLIVVFLAGSLAFATFYASEIREWHITFRTLGPSVYTQELTQTVEALTESGAKHRLYDEQFNTCNRLIVVISATRGQRVRDIRRMERRVQAAEGKRHAR